MNKRLFILLGSCLVSSILVVTVLALLSYKITSAKGSFLRAFRQHVIDERLDLNIGVNTYYLAGAGDNTVFLGNYQSPMHVLAIDCRSGDTSHHEMKITGIFEEKFWSVRLTVDSPNFYMVDGAVPRIYKGNVRDWTGERFPYDTEYFQDIEPMGSTSFAVKSLLGKERNAALGKISVTEPHFQFKRDLLQKQVDGFFCTDGYLQFDKQLNRLVYLYRYRNEFIIMDTTLQLINRSNTIDTNSVAKIKVATVQSTGASVFQTPPLVINDKCALHGDYLFVNSVVLSNNEGEDALDDASVIDVYSLTSYEYLFSFYIFDHHTGEKMHGFLVVGNKLVALFNTNLQVYDMSDEYLKGS